MKKFHALGGALALVLAGTFIAVPAEARTHHASHPSTAAEREQTADLNKQQLAIAQGQAPANQQAMNAGAAAQDQQGQMQNTNQTPNAAADQTSSPMTGGATPPAASPTTPTDQTKSQGTAPAPQGQ